MNTSKIQEAEVVTPVFKPESNYQWQPTDVFNMTGAELHLFHNTMHMVFNSSEPDPKKWIMLAKVYDISSAMIKRGVESGIIVEAKKETQEEV